MFLWLKLKHVEDSMDIFEELKAAKVVVVPGKRPYHACSLVWLTSPYTGIAVCALHDSCCPFHRQHCKRPPLTWHNTAVMGTP